MRLPVAAGRHSAIDNSAHRSAFTSNCGRTKLVAGRPLTYTASASELVQRQADVAARVAMPSADAARAPGTPAAPTSLPDVTASTGPAKSTRASNDTGPKRNVRADEAAAAAKAAAEDEYAATGGPLRTKRPPGMIKRSIAMHVGYVGTAFNGETEFVERRMQDAGSKASWRTGCNGREGLGAAQPPRQDRTNGPCRSPDGSNGRSFYRPRWPRRCRVGVAAARRLADNRWLTERTFPATHTHLHRVFQYANTRSPAHHSILASSLHPSSPGLSVHVASLLHCVTTSSAVFSASCTAFPNILATPLWPACLLPSASPPSSSARLALHSWVGRRFLDKLDLLIWARPSTYLPIGLGQLPPIHSPHKRLPPILGWYSQTPLALL